MSKATLRCRLRVELKKKVRAVYMNYIFSKTKTLDDMTSRGISDLSAEQKLYRKRMAARLRQQRCRARKRHKQVIKIPSNASNKAINSPAQPTHAKSTENLTLLPSAAHSGSGMHLLPAVVSPASLPSRQECLLPTSSFISPCPSYTMTPTNAGMRSRLYSSTPMCLPSSPSHSYFGRSSCQSSGVPLRPKPQVQFILPVNSVDEYSSSSIVSQVSHDCPGNSLQQPPNKQTPRSSLPPRKRKISLQEPQVHRRSPSEVARIEAVDAILSLKKDTERSSPPMLTDPLPCFQGTPYFIESAYNFAAQAVVSPVPIRPALYEA